MKKFLSLVLALALLCALGAAALAEGDTPTIIKVLIPACAKVSDFDDNEYTKWIEVGCNVDLQFELLPVEKPADKLATMIAGGMLEEMQIDVISFKINLATSQSYADQGAIIDLSPYYEKGITVNCNAAVEQFPAMNLVSNITTAEGAVYAIPSIQASPSNETRHKMWINQGWLNNLGLEVPTTIDEFYNMLVAFRDQDANGNGDPNDEIPFITSTGFGGTATKFLTNAFVFEGDDDLFILNDGHVSTSYMQDGWYAACDFLKKLVDEKLLMPESFTYNNDDLKAVACKEEDIVGVVTNSSCAFMGAANDPYRLRYICLNPLTGPEGVCYSYYNASVTTGCWFVTSYAESKGEEFVELCVKVGDYQFCEEGFIRGRFGIQDVNWMTKEDYLAANPGVTLAARYGAMGYEGKYVWYNDVRDQEVNNLYWYDQMPYFSGEVEAQGMYVADDGNGNIINLETNATCRQETGSGYYQLCKPGTDVYVPALAYTEEELSEIAEIRANLKNYVNEQRTKYIIGEESDLADRETFVKNLKDTFGLDTLLEIADRAYQRQYANK